MNKKKFTGTSQSLETRRSVSAILKRRLTVAIWRYPFLILKTLRNEKFTTFSKKKILSRTTKMSWKCWVIKLSLNCKTNKYWKCFDTLLCSRLYPHF